MNKIRLNKDPKIGGLYKRRDGKECILIAEEKEEGKYRFRFRLKEEHNLRCKMLDTLKAKGRNITEEEYHMRLLRGWTMYPEEIGKEEVEGDWYVRFNGCASQCSKWESNRDIIEEL